MFTLFILFFKLIFFSDNFFLLLFVTFDDVFSDCYHYDSLLFHDWDLVFCLQESRYVLGMVTGRV